MDWQVERLRQALAGDAGWGPLMAEFPELRQICAALAKHTGGSDEVIQSRLQRLYRRHVDEWHNFPARQWMLPQARVA